MKQTLGPAITDLKHQPLACRAVSLRAKKVHYDPSRPQKPVKGLYLKGQHESQPKATQHGNQRRKFRSSHGLG